MLSLDTYYVKQHLNPMGINASSVGGSSLIFDPYPLISPPGRGVVAAGDAHAL